MKQKYITLKLFGIIAVFLTLLIVLIILFQTKYFNDYYTNFKQDQFRTAVEQAKESFNKTNGSNDLLNDKLKVLYTKYNCVAALYLLDEGQPVENSIKKFMVEGIFNKDFPNINEIFYKLMTEFLLEKKETGGQLIKTVQSYRDLKYLTAIQTVTINDQLYILAMASSLQSLDEAMSTLRNISWLAYGVGFLFSLVLAAIIAKLITRPLLKEIERKKALDDMRKDFIANASHEMKTPISIISGYAESLIDGILSQEERKEYEHTIYDESQKMGKLVRDMLEIAILQNDKYELKKTNIELNKLLEKNLNRLAGHIKRKSIIVDTGKVSQVNAFVDENMMETVFINFIDNAISHTPEQGKIRLSLINQNNTIRFEIENEGLPIPESAMNSIWESFYRVDKSHNREDGRFGLGLFAVKTVIEKHKGIIGVNNTEEGVLFYFEIPMYE